MKSTLDKAMTLPNDFEKNVSAAKGVARELYDKMYENQLVVKFDVDSDVHQLIVKMVHRGTGEVAWQLPPAYSIAICKIAQYMSGIFLSEKVGKGLSSGIFVQLNETFQHVFMSVTK